MKSVVHFKIVYLNVCRQQGEGTVDYLWPKPGHDQPVAKLSYVKLFKPWNWVIGTGVYLEAAEQRFMEDAKKAIAQLRYGPKNSDYFWINDMGPKMIMHPLFPELEGKILDDRVVRGLVRPNNVDVEYGLRLGGEKREVTIPEGPRPPVTMSTTRPLCLLTTLMLSESMFDT